MKTLFSILLCLLVGAGGACAQEKASPPYAKYYGIFQKAAAMKNKDLRAVISVRPKEGVKPGDVTLTIQSKGGAQKLTVDPDGELRGFPLSDALLKENPLIVSNQPKGTLNLNADFALNVPESTTYPYRQLGALVDAANAEIKKQAGLLSFVAPHAKSVTFEFYDVHGQTLTVGTRAAPKTLRVDGKGYLTLPIDPALLTENPAVTLSEKPSKVILNL